MKSLIAAFAVVTMLGCTSSTEHGDCIGVAEDEDPTLKYEVDTGNIVLAVIFSEMIFPPLIVLLSETKCPVDPK